jgi:NAD(P)-dependent dehydrogenase (short-subunit alcohol dehydrogenase family)
MSDLFRQHRAMGLVDGRVAIITGAARGQGAAEAPELSVDGGTAAG